MPRIRFLAPSLKNDGGLSSQPTYEAHRAHSTLGTTLLVFHDLFFGPVAIIANRIVDFWIEVIGHVLATVLAFQFSSGGLLFTLFLAVLANLIVEVWLKVIRHVHLLAEDAFQWFLVWFRFRYPYDCVLHEVRLLLGLGL
jgi:hypothetical protein